MRGLWIGFGVGVGVTAGGCYLYLSALKKDELSPAGAKTAARHAALAFGLPETDMLRTYSGYVTSYDYRTRNPKWVLEHLTQASWTGDASRERCEFFEEPGVEPRFRARLADYRNSGYDRGHMAPAANHKSSQQEMDETFSLANISPQVGKGFNRDYWARFERFAKEVTRVASDVYIVTGPLWLPTQGADGKWTMQHELIGQPPGLVSVPTHFYKVVLADNNRSGGGGGGGNGGASGRAGNVVGVGAFVMPNQPIDPRLPLTAYVVPLADLEAVAGVRFFPAFLGDRKRRIALDAAAAGWREHGLAQLKPFERVTMLQAQAALPAPKAYVDVDVELLLPSNTTSTPTSSSGRVQAPPATAPTAAHAAAASPSGLPLLPLPPAASSASRAPQQQQQQQGPGGLAEAAKGALPPQPKTVGGQGAVHLCEMAACRLPPPDFYLHAGGRGAGGGRGASGGGGGGKALGPAAQRPR